MTLNLAAWNERLVALAADQRVCQLDNRGKVRVVDDERVKIVILESTSGRAAWCFNGLAEIQGQPMTLWLARTLHQVEAWRRGPGGIADAVAEEASGLREFSRLPFVHTFIFVGWHDHRPVVGIIHNGDEPQGRGTPKARFAVELHYEPGGALVSGTDEAVSDGDGRALEWLASSYPAGEALQGRLEALIRKGAASPRAKGRVGEGSISVFLPVVGTVAIRSSHAGSRATKMEMPVQVGQFGVAGVTLQLGEPVRFLTPEQQRHLRRRDRGRGGG